MKNATEMFGKKKKRIKKRLFNMNQISNSDFLLKALILLINLSYFIPISYKVISNIWIQILYMKSQIQFVSKYFLSNFTKRLDTFLIQADKISISVINLLPQYRHRSLCTFSLLLFWVPLSRCLSFVFSVSHTFRSPSVQECFTAQTHKKATVIHDNLTVTAYTTATYITP